jgi:hypothetical protein
MNKESDTPRTNAAIDKYYDGVSSWEPFIEVDFSRQLERELNQTKAEFELFRKQAMQSALMCENADLKSSRDEWMECAKALIDYSNHAPTCCHPVKPCDCGMIEWFETFKQLTARISGTEK